MSSFRPATPKSHCNPTGLTVLVLVSRNYTFFISQTLGQHGILTYPLYHTNNSPFLLFIKVLSWRHFYACGYLTCIGDCEFLDKRTHLVFCLPMHHMMFMHDAKFHCDEMLHSYSTSLYFNSTSIATSISFVPFFFFLRICYIDFEKEKRK